ncbi:MAG: hypothetical protein C0605_10065 [Hyphomicrobiales bacterium]|nr:MAG: hypothetical protein C0605_10065 [Hyphomicrobiales bacterium]
MAPDSSTGIKSWNPEKAQLPAVMQRNERRVRSGFWRKLARVAAKIPFAEDAIAAYFCAMDSRTPLRARAMLLAALVYFIAPIDMIPDVIAGLGFTDDATVLATVLAMFAGHITPEHREKAARILKSGRFGDEG